jgi:hypothetical protein
VSSREQAEYRGEWMVDSPGHARILRDVPGRIELAVEVPDAMVIRINTNQLAGWCSDEEVDVLPRRVRGLRTRDSELLSQTLGVFLAKLFARQRRRARAHGIADPHGGAVAYVQRFGSLFNLNCHAHALLPDGLFAAGSNSAAVLRSVSAFIAALPICPCLLISSISFSLERRSLVARCRSSASGKTMAL